MDWTKVKGAIGTIAPWLAGTIGSPVAGVAVRAICGALGLAGDSATPENTIAALAGATPEQLQALRDAESKHIEFMRQIGYDHIDKLEQIAAGDRDSARKRDEIVKDHTPAVLAALAVLLFLVLIIYVAAGQAPADNMREGFWLLAGAAMATFKDVYGFYFGSSAGSHDKDATIAAQAGVEK